jgi:hypothetical protein
MRLDGVLFIQLSIGTTLAYKQGVLQYVEINLAKNCVENPLITSSAFRMKSGSVLRIN